MATADKVVTAALRRILVQGADAPLEPDEVADTIFALNNYMLALDAQGVQLGFTEIKTLGDDVTVPAGALRGVIANLAIEMAPDFGGQVSEALAVAARAGEDAMRILGQSMGGTAFPSTLPIGSGNESGTSAGINLHYYPGIEDEILAETTGSIALEINTNAVAEGG